MTALYGVRRCSCPVESRWPCGAGCRDDGSRGGDSGSTGRPAGARPDRPQGRDVRKAPRRSGCRRRQGRAAGWRRDAADRPFSARYATPRAELDVLVLQHQQTRRDARPRPTGRSGFARATRRARGRADRVCDPRNTGPTRPRLCRPETAQPAAGLCIHQPVRADGAVCRVPHFRSGRAGGRRHGVAQRLSGRAAPAGRGVAGVPQRRGVRRDRHAVGAVGAR